MPTIHIQFDRSGLSSGREPLRRFSQAVLARCLDELGWEKAETTVLFCSAKRIRDLNRDYLGLDKETDVLSFPAADDLESLRSQDAPYLGDLALSLQVCARQARRKLEEEVALLLVHGLLHLLGHDHDDPIKKKRMWAETNRLLRLCADIKRPRLAVKEENQQQ